MQLNRLRIGTRLAIGFAVATSMLIVLTIVAWVRMAQISTDFEMAMQLDDRAQIISEIKAHSAVNLERLLVTVKAGNNTALTDSIKERVAETRKLNEALQKQLDVTAFGAGEAERYKQMNALRDDYLNTRDATLKKFEGLALEAAIARDVMPKAKIYLESIAAFKKFETDSADARMKQTVAEVHRAEWIFGGLVVFSIGFAVFFSWTISRSITQPLRRAVDVTSQVARGDLSQSVTTDGTDETAELLRSLANMQQALRKLVAEVRSTSDSIGTASSEIASGNSDLSSRTEQAASNLQQTAASMEQLNGTVRQSADSARQANQLASSAAEVAARGGNVVAQVVTTMDDINQSSKKINDIIGVIDGIAFQTNILALNAAVEAARAGEQGRGFAVVASEVRSLAQRSAQAAKEIKGLIGASVERVETGSKLVADAGATMQEIVGSVQRVTDIIGEITAAANEQSDGIGQVNSAVTELDRMTQQNAALVEESAAAADSLREQARRLSQTVSVFQLDAASMRAAAAPVQTSAPATVSKPVVASKPLAPAKKPTPPAVPRTPARPAAPAAGASASTSVTSTAAAATASAAVAPATRAATAATVATPAVAADPKATPVKPLAQPAAAHPAPTLRPAANRPSATDDGDWESF